MENSSNKSYVKQNKNQISYNYNIKGIYNIHNLKKSKQNNSCKIYTYFIK